MRLLWDARRRLQAMREDGEQGFVLIFVLAIITVVTILVTSTLVLVAGNVVPAVQAAYSQAATQAAQGGLQAFVASLNNPSGSCAQATVSGCTLPSNYSVVTPIPLADGATGYTATYSWYAEKDPSNQYFRVRSIGTVSQGGMSVSRTVVGDVIGGASMNILNYGVVTGFETQGSADIISRWQARTIALDANAIGAADVPIKGSSVTWSGSSPGSAAGKVAVCDSTFDNRAALPPKGAPNPYVNWTESGLAGNNYTHYAPCQTSWGTLTKLLAPANPANGAGGYFSQDALLISNSYPGGTGPQFDQPVTSNWHYTSVDAGVCGTVPGQNYVAFNLRCAGYPVEVGGTPSGTHPTVSWSPGPGLPTGAPLINSGVTCAYAGPTRVVINGDTATITSPQTNSAWVATTGAAYPSQCYVGATGNGMAAAAINLASPVTVRVITALNNGTVPKMTPAVAHGSSGWPQTQQTLGSTPSTSNSVFYAANSAATQAASGTASAADTCSATATYTGSTASSNCQWSDTSATSGSTWVADGTGWTKYSSGSCSSDPTDKLTFECEYGGSGASGQYQAFRTAVKGALNSATASYGASSSTVGTTTLSCTAATITPASATASQLACLLQDMLKGANTGQHAAGYATPSPGDHQYVVTAGTPKAGTSSSVTVGSVPTAPLGSDPFFATTTGTASTATANPQSTQFTVSRQVYGCYIPSTASLSVAVKATLASLGLASTPGTYDSTGQDCQSSLFGTSAAPGIYTWGNAGLTTPSDTKAVAAFQTTISQTTYSNFVQGASAVSSFPSMADVTQYQMGTAGTFGNSGPGDLYIEGNAGHTMAFVAADDAVVTGNFGVTDPTSVAMELVGQNNVRIYHPVQCRITDPTLIAATTPGWCPDDITGLYSNVPPSGYYPFQQYVNMRPDLANLTISSTALFALGNYAYVNCAPLGSTQCLGEFTVDNYDRGAPLGQLTEIGTLGMVHHAPVGQEWEIPDTLGQTSRPYSGYQMAQQYLNLTALISGVKDVNNVLQTTYNSSSNWHILSVSSAANS